MWKLTDLIGDYEEPDIIKVPSASKEFPIKRPKGMGWKHLESPNRLSKMFVFEEDEKLNAFVMDVLEHQASTGHHGRMTIQSPQVKIEVWTHELNDITDIDIEWAKSVSEIFEGYDE